jgi:hypothetical protein
MSQDGLWLIANREFNGIVGTFAVPTERQE